MKHTEITSLEIALANRGTSLEKITKMFSLIEDESTRKFKIAQFIVEETVCAFNNGWRENWSDLVERKYWIWWDIVPKKGGSGVGLSFAVVICRYSPANAVPRLTFKTEEIALHAAKQPFFIEIMENLYNLGKREC